VPDSITISKLSGFGRGKDDTGKNQKRAVKQLPNK
jgi:hypothetical protein